MLVYSTSTPPGPPLIPPLSTMSVLVGPTVRTAGPPAPRLRLAPTKTVPVASAISTLPEPPAVWPMFRSPPILTLAPERIDSSPEPPSPTESEPVVTRLELLPLIETMPALPVADAASSVVALTVPPAAMFSAPAAAPPTTREPAICQSEPVPITLTEDPAAAAVLAMTAPARPTTVPGVVITLPPDWIDRLPRPASPTTNCPVLLSSDWLPLTVTAPAAPASVPTSKPWVGAIVLPPVNTLAWF